MVFLLLDQVFQCMIRLFDGNIAWYSLGLMDTALQQTIGLDSISGVDSLHRKWITFATATFLVMILCVIFPAFVIDNYRKIGEKILENIPKQPHLSTEEYLYLQLEQPPIPAEGNRFVSYSNICAAIETIFIAAIINYLWGTFDKAIGTIFTNQTLLDHIFSCIVWIPLSLILTHIFTNQLNRFNIELHNYISSNGIEKSKFRIKLHQLRLRSIQVISYVCGKYVRWTLYRSATFALTQKKLAHVYSNQMEMIEMWIVSLSLHIIVTCVILALFYYSKYPNSRSNAITMIIDCLHFVIGVSCYDAVKKPLYSTICQEIIHSNTSIIGVCGLLHSFGPISLFF